MENIYLTQKAQKTQRDFLTTNETIFSDNGLDGLDGCLFNNELNELNEIFPHAARRSMTRSTFGATNDTNLQFGVANGISPRKSYHAVGIREIRCRLRLREISLYQHDYKNSFNSTHSLLKKTVWNFRNLSYSKKIRFIRAIRCLKKSVLSVWALNKYRYYEK